MNYAEISKSKDVLMLDNATMSFGLAGVCVCGDNERRLN